MTDETEANPPPTTPGPGSVPSEWSPPAAAQPPVSSLAPPVSPVASTGPIEAEPTPPRRWLGRGIALVAAAVLVGGGGFLALTAGTADGGADTPAGALDGALAALSAEDLMGAAEFVEPTERETLVAAGFDVVEELVRLEVFEETLDLSAVEGIDLAFDDVEISSLEVRPGLAHLFIDGGTASAAFLGEAVPFGALVTDRVDREDLAISEQATEPLTRSESPIVAVERDGRWYLSLWYSVAENARLELDQPLPDPADRLREIGADTPEGAVENLVRAGERLDLPTMIGMLDPEELSVLYDYGSLFVPDAQSVIDDFLAGIDEDGWSWEITEFDSRADVDGDLATVFVERLALEAGGPDVEFAASLGAERMSFSVESDELSVDGVIEGDCMTITVDEGRGAETEESCAGDMEGIFGLGGSVTPAFDPAEGNTGIVVREVDGRWYVSPVRTGSAAMLQGLRALEPEALADMVDGLVEFARDPFGLAASLGGASFDGSFQELEGFEFDEPEFEFEEPEFEFDYPPYTDDHIGLLVPGPEVVFAHDLVGTYRDDLWFQYLPDVEPREFGDGIVAQVFLTNDHFVDIAVLDDLPVATDDELAAWLGGEVTTADGFAYVFHPNSWGTEVLVARSADGVALVALYEGFSDEALAALRAQVGG